MPATLTTAASPNVTLSEPVVTLNDSATLSGGANPTGVIVFTLAGPGGFLFTQTDAVSGNAIYNASVTLPTAGTVAGTYSWTAHYSGDAANNSANDQGGSAEQTVVSPASPGLSTTASPGGIAGTTLTDIAHLSGGYLPTGTIIFLLIAPGGLPVDTETVTVNGNGTYTTPTGFTVPTGAVGGTYVWHVLYNGDANNNAATANLENVTVGVNPFPPPGTTADMILRHGADGRYEIYDIGNNSVLAAHPLGQVGTDWKFVGLGGFFGSDTTDMILRNSNTGGLEVYDIYNNAITNAASIGAIASSGNSRASAISAACPAKPISCCATPIPAGWRCTTSTITNSPAPLSSGRSGWSGSSPASPRYTHLARPISCCATKIPVHSRPTTSATT